MHGDCFILAKQKEMYKSDGKNIKTKNIIRKSPNTFYQFNGHVMSFKVIANASNNVLRRRILEAFYIAQLKPNLNDQLDSQSLKLFRYGIT